MPITVALPASDFFSAHHDDHAIHDLGPDTTQSGCFGTVFTCSNRIVIYLTPEVRSEYTRLEKEDGKDDENTDGNNLAHHDDGIQGRGTFDATDNQKSEQPIEHRSQKDAGQSITCQKRGEEISQSGHHHRCKCNVSQPGRKPVTPAGKETGQRTEAFGCVTEYAIQIRTLGNQVIQCEGEEQKPAADHQPSHQRATRRCHLRYLSSERKYTRTNT